MSTYTTQKLARRSVLTALAAIPIGLHTRARAVDASSIKLGQSIALSGPLSELGQAMHQGAKAGFAAINGNGGVNGRRIDLMASDDGYDVKRSLENVKGFLADPGIFALFNCMGTPMVEAMLPSVLESGIPYFAPFSGALSARPANAKNVFNIRASYPEEAQQLVQHLATVGIKRIAIAYQNNTFGKEIFTATQLAMAKFKVEATAIVTVENSAADAGSAAAKVATSQPQAVLLGLAGKPTIEFVKAIRAQRKGLPLYALSIMGAAATLKAIGVDATGIAVSQVVPLPNNSILPIVRDFQQAWKASNTALEPSHLALEGYINARVFAEALRRAGKTPSRSAFIDSTWAMKKFDLGGFDVSFSASDKNASRFVELTMVASDGRFIR